MEYLINNIEIEGQKFYTIDIKLPKTNLLVVGNDIGYFMCGALNVDIFDANEKLKERKVVCGCSYGVKTIDELLNSNLKKVSLECKNLGITVGMEVKEALKKLL